MVKINLGNLGGVRPSSQALAPLDVQYTPDMFGAGVGKGLQKFGAALDILKTREKETERFTASTNFTDFETQIKLDLEKLKQDTPHDASTFFQTAEATFETGASKFLESVPPELQPEFEQRMAQVRQGIVFDAFKFNYAQQSSFYKEKISSYLEKTKVTLDQNPDTLETTRAAVYDIIDSSGLSEIEKQEHKLAAAAQLESITYRREMKKGAVRQIQDDAGPKGSMKRLVQSKALQYGVDPLTMAAIAQIESSFNPNAKSSTSSASGLMQFTKGTGEKYGLTDPFNPTANADAGARLTRDNINGLRRDLGREPSPGEVYLAHFSGYGAAKKLGRADPNTPTSAIFSPQAIAANASILQGKTVGQVRQWADEKMAKAMTSLSGDPAYIDAVNNDPAFSHLTFDQRQAITADVQREATSEYNTLLTQQKAAYDTQFNQLLVGLNDGTLGNAAIVQAREAGWLTDYDDITKAQKIIADQNKNAILVQTGLERLNSGGLWLGGNEQHRKEANAMFGAEGKAQLTDQSEDYVRNYMLPQFSRMGMLAPDAKDIIMAQQQSSNPATAVFAMETMRMLREQNPVAFRNTFSEATQQDLDAWESQRGMRSQEEILASVQKRAADQTDLQAETMLRQRAKEYIKTQAIDPLQLVPDQMNGWFDGYDGAAPVAPQAQVQLTRDYTELFEQMFVKYNGNAELAKDATLKAMERRWGLSDIGGTTHLSRFPPEKAGYQPINGSYEWIERQARAMLDLPEGATFELISDLQTEEDIRQGRPASYKVFYTTEDGISGLYSNEDGKIGSIWFDVNEETNFDESFNTAYVNDVKTDYMNYWIREKKTGTAIPEDIQQRYDGLADTEKEALMQTLQNLPWLGDE